MWATMGYVEEGIKYLDLEEALFLIDEVSNNTFLVILKNY